MAEAFPTPDGVTFQPPGGRREFGRWLAVAPGRKRGHWLCRCRCPKGTEREVATRSLVKGLSRSCGCLQREQPHPNLKHGKWKTREFHIWTGMIQRCHNPKMSGYYKYGAKGIAVCERWRNSFADFLADMGASPSPEHSIDRVDNARGYEPANCRWATRKEQQRNTSQNRRLTHAGVTKTMVEWAEETGISLKVLSARLTAGWSVGRSLSEAPRRKPLTFLEHNGQRLRLTAWAERLGVSPSVIRSRLALGWNVADAVSTPLGVGRPPG
jgi:hypothetical protein